MVYDMSLSIPLQPIGLYNLGCGPIWHYETESTLKAATHTQLFKVATIK